MRKNTNVLKAEAAARGDRFYSAGVPCKYGHESVRYSSDGKCRQCVSERNAVKREDPEFCRKSSERHKKWREENLEAALENSRQWYENNREHALQLSLAWIKSHRNEVNAIRRRYYANSPKPLAYAKARQKRVRRATPPWADMPAILQFYQNTPEGYTVDHIIPINGKTVSGLHVPENFQYLTLADNSSKGNKWDQSWSDIYHVENELLLKAA